MAIENPKKHLILPLVIFDNFLAIYSQQKNAAF
jgi:hypothetical protein